jgi:tRNA G18 (ribose-2'-O)-methylase SpoU
LRKYEPTEREVNSVKRNDIWIIVDNVLDTFNIGSIFRLADAVAARKIFLVGETATPDDPRVGHKIHKASVGTYRWVPWEYAQTVKEAIGKYKQEKISHQVPYVREFMRNSEKVKPSFDKNDKKNKTRVVAIEQSKNSLDYREIKWEMPVALIVGHETRGVSKEGLEVADEIVELPMYGVNRSLNVLVALSIVCYKVLEKVKAQNSKGKATSKKLKLW